MDGVLPIGLTIFCVKLRFQLKLHQDHPFNFVKKLPH